MSQRRSKLISGILAFLIAVSSVLASYAAFQSAAIDSTSTDNYFLAQSHLNDANTLYVERGQDISYDFATYDSYIVYSEIVEDEEIAQYYYDQLSDEALAGFERDPDFPFDQAYYDAMYADAEVELEEEAIAFELASHDSNRAVAFQMTVMILAVGLSFAGWASLADDHSSMRILFTVFSALGLLAAVIQMLTIPGPLSA